MVSYHHSQLQQIPGQLKDTRGGDILTGPGSGVSMKFVAMRSILAFVFVDVEESQSNAGIERSRTICDSPGSSQ